MAGKRKLKDRPYGAGHLTEAGFWGFIRSGLREKSRRWWPILEALKDARIPVRSFDRAKWGNLIKWVFLCARCGEYYPQKHVSVNHKIPCGSLRSFDDLPGFVKRLFCEKDGLEVLCDPCHDKETEKQREERETE